MNAGNKNTPSTHHPRRRNVTTLMVGLKNGHIRKNLTQNVVNPRDIAGERKKKKKKKNSGPEPSTCNGDMLFPPPLPPPRHSLSSPVHWHNSVSATCPVLVTKPNHCMSISRPAYPKILLSVLRTDYVHIFRFLIRFFVDTPPASQDITVSKVNFSIIQLVQNSV